MESGDIHTHCDLLMQSRVFRRLNSVVSLERMSTVLFQRLVPMIVHSALLFFPFSVLALRMLSICLRYLALTGRSVESICSP